MKNPVNSFNIEYDNGVVRIDEIETTGHRLFRATFTDMPALFITRAKEANGTFFWTSLPEGRQKLAQEIGILIHKHLNANT